MRQDYAAPILELGKACFVTQDSISQLFSWLQMPATSPGVRYASAGYPFIWNGIIRDLLSPVDKTFRISVLFLRLTIYIQTSNYG